MSTLRRERRLGKQGHQRQQSSFANVGSSWDVEIEKAFFARLGRSRTQRDQYLVIQALTLARKHPHVTLRLVEMYFETAKGEFEHVRALLARVEALLELERIDDALVAMREVLSTEQRCRPLPVVRGPPLWGWLIEPI